MICACCGTEAENDATTCPNCGEASWVEPPAPTMTKSEKKAAKKAAAAKAIVDDAAKAIEESGDDAVPPAPEGEGGPSVDLPLDETMPPTEPAPASETETNTTAEPEGAADNEGN